MWIAWFAIVGREREGEGNIEKQKQTKQELCCCVASFVNSFCFFRFVLSVLVGVVLFCLRRLLFLSWLATIP